MLRLLLPCKKPKVGDVVIYVSCGKDTTLTGMLDRGVVTDDYGYYFLVRWFYPAYCYIQEYPNFERNEDADVSIFHFDALKKRRFLRVIGSCLK
jgi:hypothetical protein